MLSARLVLKTDYATHPCTLEEHDINELSLCFSPVSLLLNYEGNYHKPLLMSAAHTVAIVWPFQT